MPGIIADDEIELIIEDYGGGGGGVRPRPATAAAMTTKARLARTASHCPGATTPPSRWRLFPS